MSEIAGWLGATLVRRTGWLARLQWSRSRNSMPEGMSRSTVIFYTFIVNKYPDVSCRPRNCVTCSSRRTDVAEDDVQLARCPIPDYYRHNYSASRKVPIYMVSDRNIAAAQEAGDGSGGQIRRIDTSELFAGNREVILVHQQQNYRLRITSNGKLILTK
jgi:hemin uptake protein HemP